SSDHTGYRLREIPSHGGRLIRLQFHGGDRRCVRSDSFGLRPPQPGGSGHCRRILQGGDSPRESALRFGALTMTSNPIQRVVRCAGLWALLASYGFGQRSTAGVSGAVFDPSDAVIAGASVTLGSGDRDVLRTNTDAKGEFRFDAVPHGRYQLRVEYPGFKTQRTLVQVGSHSRGPLRVVLAIADRQETLNVESPGDRVSAESGENVDVIRLAPRLLENLPILDRDVISALSRFLDPAATGSAGATVIVD